MIKIENFEVVGWKPAIRGMRNPMNSWDKSDTKTVHIPETPRLDYSGNVVEMIPEHDMVIVTHCEEQWNGVGENDLDLMKRLVKAGTDHRKFMRMIVVYADIVAPMYWWAEYDTYKVGTVRNSCSKMHKLLSKPFEMSDFSFDKLPGYKNEVKQFRPDFDEEQERWTYCDKKGEYAVSNFGRVQNIKLNRKLSGSLHQDGYVFVTIGSKQIPVHRLVAKAYCEGYSDGMVVNHKDGNKQNNFADNLEWVTQQENVKHSHNNGLQPKGISTYKGKFTAEQREGIKLLWDSGEKSKREIARMYGVSHTCINDIISDKYKYAEKTNVFEEVARPIVDTLNELRDSYLNCDDEEQKKIIWYSILQLLPESYNQRSTVMLNYEVLANMYHSRKNHKLDEWHDFCSWVETLPYSELITGEDDNDNTQV